LHPGFGDPSRDAADGMAGREGERLFVDPERRDTALPAVLVERNGFGLAGPGFEDQLGVTGLGVA